MAPRETPPRRPRPAGARPCDCHACRPDEHYDDLDRHIVDGVHRHGWSVMSVGGGGPCDCADDGCVAVDDEPGPAFAYTIGLAHSADHPELLMSGLDHGLMKRCLDDVAARVVAGRRFASGDLLEGVLAGVPVLLEQVSDHALHDTVIWSGWFHRRRPAALAVVWPDRRGVFAWQPGAPAVLDEEQPREWRVRSPRTGAAAVEPPWPFALPPEHEVVACTHVAERGDAVLRVWRGADGGRAADHWIFDCGDPDHQLDEMAPVHLAHLVRGAPGIRGVADLAPGSDARRTDADAPWVRRRSR